MSALPPVARFCVITAALLEQGQDKTEQPGILHRCRRGNQDRFPLRVGRRGSDDDAQCDTGDQDGASKHAKRSRLRRVFLWKSRQARVSFGGMIRRSAPPSFRSRRERPMLPAFSLTDHQLARVVVASNPHAVTVIASGYKAIRPAPCSFAALTRAVAGEQNRRRNLDHLEDARTVAPSLRRSK